MKYFFYFYKIVFVISSKFNEGKMEKDTFFKLNKFLVFFFLSIFSFNHLFSADGDTVKIQTIQFGQQKSGMYIFPPKSQRFEKILMNYKLKCPCGEWDYIANVFIEQFYAPSFRINWKAQDTASFMLDTAWAYSTHPDGANLVIDSTPLPQELIKFYNDSTYPTKATDSMWVWPTYYKYTFDSHGNKTDSTLVHPDSILYLTKKRVMFSDSVTITDSWEIMRYITPYGNGLSLGNGFTWVIDVSDFEPLLHDTVFVNAPNGQEDLDLSFNFIKGVPPRDVVRIQKVYNVFANYNKYFEKYLPPVPIQFSNEDKMSRLKIIQTGHAMNGYDGCDEFCKKMSYVKINGVQRYNRYIWRDDCGLNPVYPQGGTWNLMRSNWCPGAEVRYYDYELTPFVTPGQTDTVDYDMEYYDAPIQGSGYVNPEWRITAYLITYTEPNFRNDAELLDVVSPNNDPFNNRFNPIANDPVVVIENTGGNPLKSVDINYGIVNDKSATYHWTGDLAITDTAIVRLPYINWGDVDTLQRKFFAEVSNPNDSVDEYAPNNRVETEFDSTPIYRRNLIIEYMTNKYASQQYNYTLRKLDGGFNFYKDNMADSTLYRDTFNLAEGDYEFIFNNVLGYGINYWFMIGQGWGGGYVNFLYEPNGQVIKNFNGDFGLEIFHHFRVAEKPTILTSEDTLNFGNVIVGDSSLISLNIYPANSKGLEVSNLSIVFGTQRGYSVVSTEPQLDSIPVQLDSGMKMTITIKFKPPKTGNMITSLNIYNNDDINSLKQIKLIGTGLDANGVKEFDSENLYLNVNKNPVSNHAEIKYGTGNFATTNTKLILYNSLGQLVRIVHSGLTDIDNSCDLNVSDLSIGVYYLVFSSGKSSITKPVIVVK